MPPKAKQRCCRGKVLEGYNPKVCTDQWAFYDDCLSSQTKETGLYETEWRNKIDTLPKPYKEIASSRVCLPKIPTPANQSSSHRRNHIYTRYTQEQHRRKDVVDKIEKMVKIQKKSVDSSVSSRPSFNSQRLDSVTQVKVDDELTESRKDSLKQIDLKMMEGGSKKEEHVMNTDELEAIIDVKLKNPYKAFAKPVRAPRENKVDPMRRKTRAKKKEEDDEMTLASSNVNFIAETRLKEVVQEFCDSIHELGGEDNNIDPLTVNCLFTSGYDTTPAMSAPVMMVKQSELPPGLREVVGISSLPNPAADGSKQEEHRRSWDSFEKKLKPDRNGYRYGAWYLKPKSWKRVMKNTQLLDPKTIAWEETMTDLDMKKKEVAEELSHLHVIHAFGEFIRYRNARLPEFVKEAEKIRSERAVKEAMKSEAEARARMEYLLKTNKWK